MATNAAALKKGAVMSPSGIPITDYKRKEDPRPAYLQSRPVTNGVPIGGANGANGSGPNAATNGGNGGGSSNAAQSAAANAAASPKNQPATPAAVLPATSANLLQLGAFAVSDGRRILTPSGQPYNNRHKFYYVQEHNTAPFATNVVAPAVLPGALLGGGGVGGSGGANGQSPNANQRRSSMAAGSQGGKQQQQSEVTSALPPIVPSHSNEPVAQLPFRAQTPTFAISGGSGSIGSSSAASKPLLPPGATAPSPVRPNTANAGMVSAANSPYAPMPNPNATVLASNTAYEHVLRPMTSSASYTSASAGAAGPIPTLDTTAHSYAFSGSSPNSGRLTARPGTASSGANNTLMLNQSPIRGGGTAVGFEGIAAANQSNAATPTRLGTAGAGDSYAPSFSVNGRSSSHAAMRPPSSAMRIQSCGLGMGAKEGLVFNTASAAAGNGVAARVRPLTADLFNDDDGEEGDEFATGAARADRPANSATRRNKLKNAIIDTTSTAVLTGEDILDALVSEEGAYAATLLQDFPPIPAESNLRPSHEEIAAYLEAMATWWPSEEGTPNNTASAAPSSPSSSSNAQKRNSGTAERSGSALDELKRLALGAQSPSPSSAAAASPTTLLQSSASPSSPSQSSFSNAPVLNKALLDDAVKLRIEARAAADMQGCTHSAGLMEMLAGQQAAVGRLASLATRSRRGSSAVPTTIGTPEASRQGSLSVAAHHGADAFSATAMLSPTTGVHQKERNPYLDLADCSLSAVPLSVVGIDTETVFSLKHSGIDWQAVGSDPSASLFGGPNQPSPIRGGGGAAARIVGLAGDDEEDLFPDGASPTKIGKGKRDKKSSRKTAGGAAQHCYSADDDCPTAASQPLTARPTDVARQQEDHQNPRSRNGIVEVASLIRAALLLKESVEGGSSTDSITAATANAPASPAATGASTITSPNHIVGKISRPAPTVISTLSKALNTSHQRLFGHHIWFTEAQQRETMNISAAAAVNTSGGGAAATTTTPLLGPTAPSSSAAAAACPYSLKTCIDADSFALQVRIINEGGFVIGCHLFELPLSEHVESTGEPLSVPSLTTKLSSIVNGALLGAVADEDYLLALSECLANGATGPTAAQLSSKGVLLPSGKRFVLPQPLQDPTQTAANTRRNHAALCLLSNSVPTATAAGNGGGSGQQVTHAAFLEKVSASNMNNAQLLKKLTAVAFTATVDVHLTSNANTNANNGVAPSVASTVDTIGPIEGTIMTNAGLTVLCSLKVSRDAIQRAMKASEDPRNGNNNANNHRTFDRLVCDNTMATTTTMTASTMAVAGEEQPAAPQQQITVIVEARLASAMVRTHAPLVSASQLSRAALVFAAIAKSEHESTFKNALHWGGFGNGLCGGTQMGSAMDLNAFNAASSAMGFGGIDCIVRSSVPADGFRTALQTAAAAIVAKDEELNGTNDAERAEAAALAATMASANASAAGGRRGGGGGGGSSIGTAKRMSIAPRGTLQSQAGSRSNVQSRAGTTGGASESSLLAGGFGGLGPDGSANKNAASALMLLAVGQGSLPDAVAINGVVASMDAAVVVATPAKRKSVSPGPSKGAAPKRKSSTGDASALANTGAIAGVSSNILLAPDGQVLVATVPINLSTYREQHKQRLASDAALARKREEMIAAGLLNVAVEEPVNLKGNRRGSRAAAAASNAASPVKGRVAAAAGSPANSPTPTNLDPLNSTLASNAGGAGSGALSPYGSSAGINTITVGSGVGDTTSGTVKAVTELNGTLSFWLTRAATNELQSLALASSAAARSWETVTVEMALPDPMLLPIAVAAVTQEQARRSGYYAKAGSKQPILHYALRAEDGGRYSATPFPRPADVFSLSTNSLDVYLRARLIPYGTKTRQTNKATLHQALFATRSAARALIAFAGIPLKWSSDEASQFVASENREVMRPGRVMTYAPYAYTSLVSGLRNYRQQQQQQEEGEAAVGTVATAVGSAAPQQHPIGCRAEVMFSYMGTYRPHGGDGKTAFSSLAGPDALRATGATPAPTTDNSFNTSAGGGGKAATVYIPAAPSSVEPLLTHSIELTPRVLAKTTISLQVRATTASMASAFSAAAAGGGAGDARSVDAVGGRVVRATFVAHPIENVAVLAAQVEAMAKELVNVIMS